MISTEFMEFVYFTLFIQDFVILIILLLIILLFIFDFIKGDKKR